MSAPFNEKSTVVVTAAFTDENGDDVTPTDGTYRIDDLGSGTAILAATALPSLGTSVPIVITSAQNALVSQGSTLETRVVTVEFGYGTGKHGTAEYSYQLKNLYGVN